LQKLGTDIKSGAVFVALGLFFSIYSFVALPIGTPNRMGPGYFPISLAVILIALGLGIMLYAHDRGAAPQGNAAPWRSVLLIVVALAIFGFTIRGLGMVPAIAILTFVATFASRRTTLPQAIAATVGITAFCVGVFYYLLNLNVLLIGPWLRLG
jgi:hypothetical protein